MCRRGEENGGSARKLGMFEKGLFEIGRGSGGGGGAARMSWRRGHGLDVSLLRRCFEDGIVDVSRGWYEEMLEAWTIGVDCDGRSCGCMLDCWDCLGSLRGLVS